MGGWVGGGGGTLQALYVLEAMHNSGLRHRDIRPDNLLLFDGSVMVIDFAFGCGTEPALYVWGSPLVFQKSGLIERACTEALSQAGSLLSGLGLCINGQPPVC
jgi:serine/threonine protein kinase